MIRPVDGAKAAAIGRRDVPRKKIVVVIGPHARAQPDLLEVVHALDALRLGLGPRQRRQEQRGENGDDGNDHQQFDQSKCFELCESFQWHSRRR